jgi:hypothetical protein
MPFKWKPYFQNIKERIYLHPLARFFYLPFLKIPRDKKYIFIVGCYNSGTTLLNSIIGVHPEISMLETEGNYLTPVLKKPEQFDWIRMYHKCLPELAVAENEREQVFTQLKKDWGFWHDTSKPVLLEKSIANAIWIDELNTYFDNPYFIWIIRNGYALSEGIRRRTRGRTNSQFPKHEYPIDLCARQWCVSNQIIEEKLHSVAHKYALNYEDLTDTPEETVQKLLHWLPVKGKKMELLSSFQFHGESSPIKNMNENSIRRLSSEDIDAVNEVAVGDLKKFNYPALGEIK